MKLTNTRLLTLIIVLLFCIQARATDATLSGTIRDPFGNAFNGQITFTLSQPAVDPTGVVDYVPLQVPFTVLNGALPSGAKLVSNASLQPNNTYYLAQYFDPTGQMTQQKVFYFLAGANNLGSMVPTNITTNNVSYLSPVDLAADNTFTGNNTFTKKIISTVSAGTPPFQVASGTKVSLLTSAALISDSANVAATGVVRLANADSLCFRDLSNTYDDCIRQDPTQSKRMQMVPTDGLGQKFNFSFTHYWESATSGYGTVVNTTTAEQNFVTSGIDANGLALAGSAGLGGNVGYHFRFTALATNTTGSNVNYTMRVRLDNITGTVLCASPATVVGQGSNIVMRMDCYILDLTTGGAGTIEATGNYFINNVAGEITNATAITLDTTIAHLVLPTIQMGTSSALASFKWGTQSVTREGK